MRRGGILLIWLCAAVLAVAAGALMPGLALHIQDARLENAVESAQVETVEMSLLSELTPAETLYLANHYESYVVLDRGRLMTAQDAADTVTKILSDFIEYHFGYDPQDVPEVGQVEPRLYMGENGENVVLWSVTLTGRGTPLPMDLLYGGAGDRCDITGSALLDERTGGIAAMDISWLPPAADVELPEMIPYGAEETAEEAEAEAPASEPLDPELEPTPPSALGETEQDRLEELMGWSYDIFWTLADTLGGGGFDEYDAMPGLFRMYLPDGTSFEVPVSLTMYSILFNR